MPSRREERRQERLNFYAQEIESLLNAGLTYAKAAERMLSKYPQLRPARVTILTEAVQQVSRRRQAEGRRRGAETRFRNRTRGERQAQGLTPFEPTGTTPEVLTYDPSAMFAHLPDVQTEVVFRDPRTGELRNLTIWMPVLPGDDADARRMRSRVAGALEALDTYDDRLTESDWYRALQQADIFVGPGRNRV